MDRIDVESKKFLSQPVLKSQFLKNENSELVMNVSKKYADIIKRYEDGTCLDLLVIENQSTVDHENQKREFDREAVKLVYEITKIEALLKLLEESQGDVKVCEAWNEMMEEARTKD